MDLSWWSGPDYRDDDTGDTLALSRFLEAYTGNAVWQEGNIERSADMDAFQFTTSGGPVSLQANPQNGDWANLAIMATLANSADTLIASNNPQTQLNAAINMTLPAGTYTFRVTGAGRNDPLINGFSSYGSLGYYSITGSVAGIRLPSRFTLDESSPNGTVVGTVTPNGTGTLTYAIVSGNTNEAFAINNSGVLTVANSAALDYELMATSTSLRVQCELFVDITNLTTPALTELNRRVVVEIRDVNEPPVITGLTNTVVEHAPIGTFLGFINVSDLDLDQFVTYTIADGDPGSKFTLSSSPYGSITLLVAGDLDATVQTNYLLTLTATDNPIVGSPIVSTGFVQIVVVPNMPPTISGLTNQTTVEGVSISQGMTVADAETFPWLFQLSGWASDPALVPTNNIVFGGVDYDRTVTVTPAAGRSGSTVITVVVSDGSRTASNSFTLTVTSLPTGTKSFTNTTAIVLADTIGSVYPSEINISGLGGAITNVTLTLRAVNHAWGRDIDALLVGPSGQKVMLMSDAGTTPTAVNANFTFSDNAANFLPATGALQGGTYKPTDYEPGETMSAPAPVGPYATNLSEFNGQAPSGTWQLYVLDDGSGDTGSIAGGWSLTVATASVGPQPPTITDLSDQTTLSNTPTPALAFTIADTDTPIASLTLSNASTNPTLVPINNIVFGGSGSNRIVTVTPAPGQSGTATISVFVSDGTAIVSDTFLLTVVTAFPQTLSFTNASSIGIRDTNGALPYPSTILVSGMSGAVSNVTVTLRGFTHTWSRDVDVLLVGPTGKKLVLMSDAGNGPVNNLTLSLSDSAATVLPSAALTSGSYRTTNFSDGSPFGDSFPSPAPSPPYGTSLSVFIGTAPNGTWSLYVFDDGPGDTGSITNGWSLTISAQPASPPPMLNVLAGGGSLTLNWPLSYAGYTLQVQSNAASVGLGTNWFNITSGVVSNSYTTMMNRTNGAVFYRLIGP